MQQITYPIKILKKLGVKTLIVTNAAGGVNENFKTGDLMLITDHINFMGANPLVGENDETLGERFPDMTNIYNIELRKIAKECAMKLNFDIKEGVYFANSGPSYETPAEIRMAKILGADAVGMSTVPEAIVANYCGIKVLGVSCITNSASAQDGAKLSHADVILATENSKIKFKNLVVSLIANV